MKRFIPFLFIASMVFAAPEDEAIDTSEPFLAEETIAAFEPNLVIQQPLTIQDLPSIEPVKKKSSYIAVSLSALIPGLGHAYLGDWSTSTALFGSSCAATAVAILPSDSAQMTGRLTAQNIWFYGLYSAYRDVRKYNGQAGYAYPMPTDTLSDLTAAPFRPSVLKKPEVWGGFLGAMALGFTTAYFAFPEGAHIRHNLSSSDDIFPAVALPIGIGEETFFRGMLQSQFSEMLTPWGGIAVSSLAFGAMHIPNAASLEPEHRWRYYSFSLPLITALGAYFGWITHKNHSLKESVAVHTWYDFTLFAIGALASRAAIGAPTQFSFSTEF